MEGKLKWRIGRTKRAVEIENGSDVNRKEKLRAQGTNFNITYSLTTWIENFQCNWSTSEKLLFFTVFFPLLSFIEWAKFLIFYCDAKEVEKKEVTKKMERSLALVQVKISFLTCIDPAPIFILTHGSFLCAYTFCARADQTEWKKHRNASFSIAACEQIRGKIVSEKYCNWVTMNRQKFNNFQWNRIQKTSLLHDFRAICAHRSFDSILLGA